MFQGVKYDYNVDLTGSGTGGQSEYEIEHYWKVVVVFPRMVQM